MAVSINPPLLTPMPPAPLPTDAEAVFDAKAGASLTAQGNLVGEQNLALAWQAGSMADTKGYMDAAATSAGNAAESAELAQEQVGLVTEQVEAAVVAREGAEAAEAQALVYLQATEAGAGIPPAIPDSFLGTDAEGNPLWKSITIPPAFAVGDLLDSSRTLTAPNWLVCDGAAYLQSSYPALFTKIGAASKPFEPAVAVIGPSTPINGNAVAFSPDGAYLAFGSSGAGYLNVYKKSGDTFTALSLTGPGSTVNGVVFSADGVYLAAASTSRPYITIYKRSGDVFTKLANPATLPPAAAAGVDFSPDGNYLAVGHGGSPYITIYKRNGDVFTKLADPAVIPAGTQVYGVSFSPDGNYLAVGHGGSPYITIYKRNGDVFTKLADPAVIPTNGLSDATFSADGKFLSVVGGAQSSMYSRSGDVLTKMTTSLTLGTGVAFSPDSRYLAISSNGASALNICKEAQYDTKTEFVTPTLTQPGTFAAIKRYIKA